MPLDYDTAGTMSSRPHKDTKIPHPSSERRSRAQAEARQSPHNQSCIGASVVRCCVHDHDGTGAGSDRCGVECTALRCVRGRRSRKGTQVHKTEGRCMYSLHLKLSTAQRKHQAVALLERISRRARSKAPWLTTKCFRCCRETRRSHPASVRCFACTSHVANRAVTCGKTLLRNNVNLMTPMNGPRESRCSPCGQARGITASAVWEWVRQQRSRSL